MSGFLLDSSVLSAFAPERVDAIPNEAREFFERNGADLLLSSMTIAEISKGLAKLRRSGSTKRADALQAWLDDIENTYRDRVLPFDAEAARIAGEMDDAATARGLADIIIASTARAHSLTVVTVNTRHFEALDVPLLNPFERSKK